MLLTPKTLRQIDEIIPRYPEKRSAVLPLLHLVQEDKGFISGEAVIWIAQKLGIEPVHVLGLITFYPMFRREPAGRHVIRVCHTLSCALAGSHRVCEAFLKEFNCGLDEVSPDGHATIEFVECLASCASGPAVMIDEALHERVDPERARQIAAGIKSEAPPACSFDQTQGTETTQGT